MTEITFAENTNNCSGTVTARPGKTYRWSYDLDTRAVKLSLNGRTIRQDHLTGLRQNIVIEISTRRLAQAQRRYAMAQAQNVEYASAGIYNVPEKERVLDLAGMQNAFYADPTAEELAYFDQNRSRIAAPKTICQNSVAWGTGTGLAIVLVLATICYFFG